MPSSLSTCHFFTPVSPDAKGAKGAKCEVRSVINFFCVCPEMQKKRCISLSGWLIQMLVLCTRWLRLRTLTLKYLFAVHNAGA